MSLTHLYHVCVMKCTIACISHFRATSSLNQPKPSSEEDYLFVEQPSKDYFCPVMFGLLLKPHLTSCCGNHISQEAASRIQRERGACPLCNTHRWSTMFSKHFQRQVKSVHVFCHHDDRGCGWQGELANFYSHVLFCPIRDSSQQVCRPERQVVCTHELPAHAHTHTHKCNTLIEVHELL